jgi:hypothetical protein
MSVLNSELFHFTPKIRTVAGGFAHHGRWAVTRLIDSNGMLNDTARFKMAR